MADAAYYRAYYAKNRERELAKVKRWQVANSDKVLKTRRAYTAQRAAQQRRARYGITEEQYQEMLVSQEGKCAICSRVLQRPHVDHDHATGHVRGLLCDNCNRGIGHLQENTEVLAAAIKYLKKEMD